MRRVNYDFDYMQTKDYRVDFIRNFHYEHGNLFEKAATETIEKLKIEIQKQEEKINELYIRISNDSTTKEYDINDDPFAQIRDLKWDKDRNNEHMFAFNQMRIIYLAMHLETSMSILIETAYPQTDTKNFHHWDTMVSFFNEAKIDISNLDGYSEVVQLRKLSNALKHTNPKRDVWKIPEFVAPYNFFGSINMEHFYLRVRPKYDSFRKNLNEAIIEKLE